MLFFKNIKLIDLLYVSLYLLYVAISKVICLDFPLHFTWSSKMFWRRDTVEAVYGGTVLSGQLT